MEHPLIKLDNTLYTDGSYDTDTHLIALNLSMCKKDCKDYNISFNEYISRVINHEILHHILNTNFDEYTSRGLDNLIVKGCNQGQYTKKALKKYLDVWLW